MKTALALLAALSLAACAGTTASTADSATDTTTSANKEQAKILLDEAVSAYDQKTMPPPCPCLSRRRPQAT